MEKMIDKTEKIKELIQKGFDIELLAFELDIPIEQLKNIKKSDIVCCYCPAPVLAQDVWQRICGMRKTAVRDSRQYIRKTPCGRYSPERS